MIEVTPGFAHQIRNISSAPLAFLVISQPAGQGIASWRSLSLHPAVCRTEERDTQAVSFGKIRQ